MIEKFKTYFETLEGLSTEELDRSAEKLVRAEKRSLALVIAHIAEMSRRKGHLERGYKNLFEYGTRRLNLSEGSVARRIQVANVSRRFPQILVALAENRMSLTVAGLLAPVLTESNLEKLLFDCTGMTKREVEEYLVAFRPKPVFAPSIRKAPSPPALISPPAVLPTPPQPAPRQATMPRPVPRVSPSILEPARPDLFNFRFSADRKFKEKFERLAEVLGVENPLQHMAEILERALDIALDKKDLKRKRARRLERKSRSGDNARQESRPGKIVSPSSQPATICDAVVTITDLGGSQRSLMPGAESSTSGRVPTKSRYIPSHIRERVHERANHQCQSQGPDGIRCRSRTGLEIDHQRPFALFRSHDEKYLQLFCHQHNRWSAEKVFGAAFIQQKIDASRRRPLPNGRADSSQSGVAKETSSIVSFFQFDGNQRADRVRDAADRIRSECLPGDFPGSPRARRGAHSGRRSRDPAGARGGAHRYRRVFSPVRDLGLRSLGGLRAHGAPALGRSSSRGLRHPLTVQTQSFGAHRGGAAPP